MQQTLSPRLLQGLSIYQDVVLAGETAIVGQRDCQARWRLIEPHLPASGAMLDVGSNFGWFALQVCQSRPQCVVASAEADWRSARVQRAVLASHVPSQPVSGARSPADRICLIRRRLNGRTARVWVDHRQRFDATLCLNVLHWISDHREFLHALGAISARIFIEHPDPAEQGAGIERVRREIGPIGSYLAEVFPHRPVVCLGAVSSHREGAESAGMRTIWLVEPPQHWPDRPSPGLDAAALMKLTPAWPDAQWWCHELAAARPFNIADDAALPPAGREGVWFAPGGIRTAGEQAATVTAQLARQATALPAEIRPRWRDRARDLLRSIMR